MTRMSIQGVKRAALLPWVLMALLTGCATLGGGTTSQFLLHGEQQVPPVNSPASGSGTITVRDDGSISGRITTTGVQATVAHIHMANAGRNGKIIIPLNRTSDNTWEVPSGAKLAPDQLQAYRTYGLYINVHSAAHKGGEIRGQFGPQ